MKSKDPQFDSKSLSNSYSNLETEDEDLIDNNNNYLTAGSKIHI